MPNADPNLNAPGAESAARDAERYVALRVRIFAPPGLVPFFPRGNRIASLLLCQLIDARLPGAKTSGIAALNRSCFIATCLCHRTAIATLRAIIAESALESVAQIFWFDRDEGIWRCAYPDTRLRLSPDALLAECERELAWLKHGQRQYARLLALRQFGRGLFARLRDLLSAFRPRR
jgi:hypothetical protein